jgi:phosphocarrier protein
MSPAGRPVGEAAAKVTVTCTVCNSRGLHARASALFVRRAERFDAKVTVSRDGETVPGTSIMGLMMLAAGPGAEIVIAATGRQAAAAVKALAELVGCGFEEEDAGERSAQKTT